MTTAVKVARMHMASAWTYVGVPAIILGGAVAVTLAIFLIIPNSGSPMYAGSAQAPLWYFAVLGVQALTLVFPFSQAMSVTRRSFFLGTVGLFAAYSLAWAVLFWLLGVLEDATAGWGLGGYIFAIPWITGFGPLATVLFLWTATLFVFIAGFAAATVYKRWGATILVLIGIGLALVLVGLLALVNVTDSWAWLGSTLASLHPLGVAAGLGVGVIVLGFCSYLVLRRTVP